MSTKRRKGPRKLKVKIEFEPSPDGAARWAAAMDMLLGRPPEESEEKEIGGGQQTLF
jgi:hypothetical protein